MPDAGGAPLTRTVTEPHRRRWLSPLLRRILLLNALPPALQATIHPLVAEHALAHSRDRVQKGILSAKSLAELPPVKQRMFRDNPINGRRALYIGAHAGRIMV